MTRTDGTQPKSKIATVIRVTSGNFLEMFDFFLFTFYASNIAAAFFPDSDQTAGLLKTFGVAGLGFLMRPIGALVLGPYIDRVGRRKGLIVTLTIMAMGTILIAFVPGYATIGVAAPALVMIGRLLQGFSAGVELGGVSVYLSEMATPGHKGFYVAWQSASQQVAVMFAAVIGYTLSVTLSKGQIADWGWRIPFFIGCMIVPVLFYIRSSLAETPEFEARKHHPSFGEIYRSIIAGLPIILLGMLMVVMTTVTFYTITNYTPTYAAQVLKLTVPDSQVIAFCVGLSNFIWLPIMGALSDRIGRKPILLIFSALTLVTAYPALAWLVANISFTNMLIVLLWLSFLYGSYNGAMVAALTEIIPANVRTAGFSLAYALSTAIFGGFAAWAATKLIDMTHNNAAPGIILAIAGACGLAATLAIYRKGSQASLDASGVARAAE